MNACPKSLNLVHFRFLELKIFCNHGDYWMSLCQESLNLVHFRFFELKIFFNLGEVLKEFLPKTLESGAFQISRIEDLLQPRWSIEWFFAQNPWIQCISDLLNRKFSSTMLKYWMSACPQSLILVHFRFLELLFSILVMYWKILYRKSFTLVHFISQV